MEITGAMATIEAAIRGPLTASQPPFDMSQMARLMNLSEMTDSECDELRRLALAMPAEHVPASRQEFAKHLQFIKATLPTQYSDEESGQQRTAVYARILGDYSNAALSYMTERVCRELDWFPTPRQCLTILADYRPPATRKDTALQLCANHTQAKFDEWLQALRAGADPVELTGKPERWLRIATEQGYLRCVEGEYVQRKAMLQP
jgi:hypothetical protein